MRSWLAGVTTGVFVVGLRLGAAIASAVLVLAACGEDEPPSLAAFCDKGCGEFEKCGGTPQPELPCQGDCQRTYSGLRDHCPDETNAYIACATPATWECVDSFGATRAIGCDFGPVSACASK